jgi:hypothetical protein
MSKLRLAFVLAVVSLGCGDDAGTGGGGGGTTSSSTTTSSTTTGGTTTSTTSSTTGSTSSSTSTGQGGGGGGDCAAIIAAVDDALTDAKACNPLIDVEQCTQVLEGPCCPVAVNPGNAAAVQAFQQAMTDLEDSGCVVMCPEIPCIDNPVGLCVGNTQNGSCTENPPN